MTQLLSMLVCLAMLFSGAATSQDANAYISNVLTIHDASLSINGEEYPIDPKLSIGVATENGQALLDFHMPCGEEMLFPLQAKLSEDGVAVLLGQSSTAYTFTPELLSESMDEGDEAAFEALNAYLGAYIELMSSWNIADVSLSATPEKQQARTELLNSLLSNLTAEPATVEVGGETLNATRCKYSLSGEAMLQYLEFCYRLYVGDRYADAYLKYLSATQTLTGGELTELQSLADILTYMPFELSADVDATLTADGYGTEKIDIHFSIPNGEDTIQLTLPVDLTFEGENSMSIVSEFSVEGVALAADIRRDGDDFACSLKLGGEALEDISLEMNLNMHLNEDGSFSMAADYSIAGEGVSLLMNIGCDAAADGTCAASFSISVAYDDIDIAASFCADTARSPIVDRIADAAQVTIASEDELENANGLMLAAIGLAGDVEKLMNNESILNLAAAIETLQAQFGYDFDDDYDDYGDYDDYDDYDDYSTDPADLPFTAPQLSWLPDGYALTDTQVYAYDGYGEITYTLSSSDESQPDISVDFYASDYAGEADPDFAQYSFVDGKLVPIEGPIITVYSFDGYCSVSGEIAGLYFGISGDSISLETAEYILGGLVSPLAD